MLNDPLCYYRRLQDAGLLTQTTVVKANSASAIAARWVHIGRFADGDRPRVMRVQYIHSANLTPCETAVLTRCEDLSVR